MNDGKRDEPLLAQPDETVPAPYLAFARWLFQHADVLEVWGMVSDLPEISVPETAVTLDAGAWFVCRVNLPPIAERGGIISFVRQEST